MHLGAVPKLDRKHAKGSAAPKSVPRPTRSGAFEPRMYKLGAQIGSAALAATGAMGCWTAPNGCAQECGSDRAWPRTAAEGGKEEYARGDTSVQ